MLSLLFLKMVFIYIIRLCIFVRKEKGALPMVNSIIFDESTLTITLMVDS
jgi:hypothetical protein